MEHDNHKRHILQKSLIDKLVLVKDGIFPDPVTDASPIAGLLFVQL